MKKTQDIFILYIRFKLKEGKKEVFQELLSNQMDRMQQEASFISGVLSEDIDAPNEMTLYKNWKGTKEGWLSEELPKAYRASYEEQLPDLVEERMIQYLTPTKEWNMNLLT